MRFLQLLTLVQLVTLALADSLPMDKPFHRDTLYATGLSHGSNVLFTVNQESGTATVVGPTGNDTYLFQGGLKWDPGSHTLYASGYDTVASGYLFAAYQPALYKINMVTGTATLVGFLDSNQDGFMSNGGGDLAYDTKNHTMYATGCDSQLIPNHGGQTCDPGLFTINLKTGAASLVSILPVGRVHDGGLAYDPFNNFLYATGSDPNGTSSELVRIDPATGDETLVGITESGLGLAYGGLDFDTRRQLLFADGTLNANNTNPSFLFTINSATAAIHVVGDTESGPGGLAQGGLSFVAWVPEPSTILLLMPLSIMFALRVRYRSFRKSFLEISLPNERKK